jgi:hypothetical protein
MPTVWSINAAEVCSPEGSCVSIQFRVVGLGFNPVLRLSKVIDSVKDGDDNLVPTIGPIIGWRWNRTTQQFVSSF